MQNARHIVHIGLVALLAVVLELTPAHFGAVAQTSTTPVGASVSLNETTVKALQEALNKQGIAISVNGVLNDETRAAVRKYQTQHHLPVTGEPDKATLDKLGVQISAAPIAPETLAQAASPPSSGTPAAPQTNAMNCPMMMQGQMAAMMQMMQGMMDMMKSMQGQMMQPGQMPGAMPR